MAPRLKVFQWSDGFHAFTVAASSRPKALAAWGVAQDLFATGLAHEVTDSPDRDAALQRPGQVIERGLTINIGKAKPRRAPSPKAEAKKRLKAAEAAWREREKQMASEAADLQRRLADLQSQQADLAAAHAEERLEAEARLAALRSEARPHG